MTLVEGLAKTPEVTDSELEAPNVGIWLTAADEAGRELERTDVSDIVGLGSKCIELNRRRAEDS